MRLDIDISLAETVRALDKLERRQIPFAAALTINDGLQEVKAKTPGLLESMIDAPTPFTKRGTFVSRASKQRLAGVVGFRDVQAKYLQLQAQGGTRQASGRAIVVPAQARRNKYGNLPRGAMRRALAKPNVFSGKVGGQPGIWQRPRGKRGRGSLKLLALYATRAQYRKRLHWKPRGVDILRGSLPRSAERRLAQALRSMR